MESKKICQDQMMPRDILGLFPSQVLEKYVFSKCYCHLIKGGCIRGIFLKDGVVGKVLELLASWYLVCTALNFYFFIPLKST